MAAKPAGERSTMRAAISSVGRPASPAPRRMRNTLRGDEHRMIASAYDWSGIDTVVDVGGGAGSLLAAVLERNHGTRGVLVEQPEVLPDARRLLSQRGVQERCECLGGSFFDPIAATGEVWTLCQVLHDWPDPFSSSGDVERRKARVGRSRLRVMPW